MKKTIFILGLIMVMAITTVSAYNYTFTETDLLVDGSEDYQFLSASDDGQYIIVGTYIATDEGQLLLSDDYGESFTQLDIGGSTTTGDWWLADVSSTGQYMAVHWYNSYTFYSDDYGATWNNFTEADTGLAMIIVNNNNGDIVYRNTSTDYLRYDISEDAFSNFLTDGYYIEGISRDDFQTILFGQATGPFQISYDGGATSSNLSVEDMFRKQDGDVSDDGNIILVHYWKTINEPVEDLSDVQSVLALSKDAGSTWSYHEFSGDAVNYYYVRIVNDGIYLLGNYSSEELFFFDDSFTFEETNIGFTSIPQLKVGTFDITADAEIVYYAPYRIGGGGFFTVGVRNDEESVEEPEEEEEESSSYKPGGATGSSSGRAESGVVAREAEVEEEIATSESVPLSDGAKKALGFAAIAVAAYMIMNGGGAASSSRGRSRRRRR